ncbi:glycosyltransferase [Smaragdicoccus niigatensis]|uniref:glycosyltransferase n=1 Tax=Smaragdicoccus niigatensis TaxID=359359 RepID=UPI0003819D0B|nr:glycosyltransferase [Smaragdicoccus niigatensis]
MNAQLLKFAARRVIEGGVHLRRLGPSSDKRLVILPNGPATGSNLLWGRELAIELRRIGWRVIVIPPELDLVQRRRVIAAEKPHAILMIKGRHPLNRPSLYPDVPTVFVLDDADYLLPDEAQQTVDCCRESVAVLAGNRVTADWARQHNANVEVVWVSHPVPNRPVRTANRERRDVVAWAHAAPWRYPIEAQFVHDVVLGVAQRRSFEFWLYGSRFAGEWDSYVEPLRKAGVTVRVLDFRRSYRSYLRSLQHVAVGLHPVCLANPYSHGKSFGKALSYLASDVAVVTHDVLDHAQFFRHGVNGMTPNSVEGFVDAVGQLLDDRDLRQSLVENGRSDFIDRLSTPVAAQKVDDVLRNRVTCTPSF